jgi:hypothetical protein
MSSYTLRRGGRPIVQVLTWPAWKGVTVYRWDGDFSRFFAWSLYLGWVEIRVWQKP